MRKFWLISLCVILVLVNIYGLNLPIRMALIAETVLISIDIISQVRRIRHGRTEKAKD